MIAWVEDLVVPSGMHAGKKFRLRPWQKAMLREIYDGPAGQRTVRLALLSMGRKNGKTGLAAALALCHLCGPEAVQGGQVVSGAGDRPQAALVYSAMEAMALANQDIADRLTFRTWIKEIIDAGTGSVYKALSSDAKKAHGLSPSFWIADELAQWRNRSLLDALRGGMGAHREPLGLILSTRSPDRDNPLEELLAYAETDLADDPTFKAFVYSAPLDADPWVEDTWRAANPGLGDIRSLEDVQILAAQARKIPSMEAAFRAYVLNQPVAVEERWIAPADWDACSGTAEPEGPCYGGLDLAAGASDLTAFSLFWPETGLLRVWAFLPEQLIQAKEREDGAPYAHWRALGYVIAVPGVLVARDWLGAWTASRVTGEDLVAIAADRWLFEDLRSQWEREGVDLPLVAHGAGYNDVSPSLRAFEARVLDRSLLHGGNPLLRWAVSNAVIATDPAGNRKLDKAKTRGRIDPVMSAIFAVGTAARAERVELNVSLRVLVA